MVLVPKNTNHIFVLFILNISNCVKYHPPNIPEMVEETDLTTLITDRYKDESSDGTFSNGILFTPNSVVNWDIPNVILAKIIRLIAKV